MLGLQVFFFVIKIVEDEKMTDILAKLWGLLILLFIIIFVLCQTSPYFRERIEDTKESLEDWWAVDHDIEPVHLRSGHFQDMVDMKRTRRQMQRLGNKMKHTLPKQAQPHPLDMDCYFLYGEEFCH